MIGGDRDSTRRSDAVVNAVALIPFAGVILSVLLVFKVCVTEIGIGVELLQVVNLLVAVVLMLLLGGYGMSRSSH
jgi:hypothetical protein